MNKHYIGIIGAILAGTVLIAGSILYTGPKSEEILSLREEVVKLEVLLDSTLQILQHERLVHFGMVSDDMQGRDYIKP